MLCGLVVGESRKAIKDKETTPFSLPDFILRYGYFLSQEMGKSWYRGRHELLCEIPVNLVTRPETAVITGINFLACWNFTASETIVPYIFAGGGIVYTNLDVPELGSEVNGNYQAGFGVHYFIKKDTSVDFSCLYHHISNAGTAKPNDPLNSSKVMVGISFFL